MAERTAATRKKQKAPARGRKSATTKAAKATGETRQSARKPSPRRRARAERKQTPLPVSEFPLPPEVEERYGSEKIEMIRHELPGDARPADFLRLLLEGIRLHADPLRGDVYLARDFARDGGEPGYAVAATRDTLLRYAEMHPDFRGYDAAALYADDEFAKGDPDGAGNTLRKRAGISHSHKLPGSRGALVGAWCAVEREGRPPVVFVASVEEYLPDMEALEDDDPRRKYPDRYMVKAAMCWPLRMAYHLNDVVGAEELRPPTATASTASSTEPGQASSGALDPLEGRDLDEIDLRVIDLFREGQRYAPDLWTRAKVRARVLDATTDAEREQLAAEMEKSLAPYRRDALEGEAIARAEAVTLEEAEARVAELEAFDTRDLDAEDLDDYKIEVAVARGRVEELRAASAAAAA